MKRQLSIELLLFGISICSLIGVLIAGPTRWIVISQLKGLADPALVSSSRLADEERRFAKSKPRDFDVQLAVTESNCSSAKATEDAFLDLERRFPNCASAYANSTRAAAQFIISRRVEWGASEEKYFSITEHTGDTTMDATQESLVQFSTEQCKQGERLEPDNAYFPWMLASQCYYSHENGLALSSILKSDSDTTYNDYMSDAVFGDWREITSTEGGINCVCREDIYASVLFPQCVEMRAAARMAAFQAMRLEQSGDITGGINVRRAIMHFGSMMRADSSNYICNLVGMAIVAVATDSPGGGAHISINPTLPKDQQADDRYRRSLARYDRYLKVHGYSNQLLWLDQEIASDQIIKLQVTPYELRLYGPTSRDLDWEFLSISNVVIAWMSLTLFFGGGIFKFIQVCFTMLDAHEIDGDCKRGLAVSSGAILLSAYVAKNLRWTNGVFVAQISPVYVPTMNVFSHISALLTLSAPFILYSAVLVAAKLYKKEPPARSIAVKLVANMPTTLSVLLLCYCTSIVVVARQDETIKQEFVSIATMGIGQYAAKKAGITWPRYVPMPPSKT